MTPVFGIVLIVSALLPNQLLVDQTKGTTKLTLAVPTVSQKEKGKYILAILGTIELAETELKYMGSNIECIRYHLPWMGVIADQVRYLGYDPVTDYISLFAQFDTVTINTPNGPPLHGQGPVPIYGRAWLSSMSSKGGIIKLHILCVDDDDAPRMTRVWRRFSLP